MTERKVIAMALAAAGFVVTGAGLLVTTKSRKKGRRSQSSR